MKIIKKIASGLLTSMLLAGMAYAQGTAPTTITLYGVTVGGKINLPECDSKVKITEVEEPCIVNQNRTSEIAKVGFVLDEYMLVMPLAQQPAEWAGPLAVLFLDRQGVVHSANFITKGRSVQQSVLAKIEQSHGAKPTVYGTISSDGRVVDDNGDAVDAGASGNRPDHFKAGSIYAEWLPNKPQTEGGRTRTSVYIALHGDIQADHREHMGVVVMLMIEN